jgi:hypothetical protein
MLVAAVAPNFTVAPAAKFVPAIVTAVPPATGPLFGATLLTVGPGCDVYVNPLLKLPLCVLGLVTVTVTAPALPAGVVAMIVPLFTTVMLDAVTLPNLTVAAVSKFVPVIVTTVPPASGPLFGDTLFTNGAVPETTARNETICITHAPFAFRGAQAW